MRDLVVLLLCLAVVFLGITLYKLERRLEELEGAFAPTEGVEEVKVFPVVVDRGADGVSWDDFEHCLALGGNVVEARGDGWVVCRVESGGP